MDKEMPKDIERAELVKRMREERAWPQKQLAEVADINLRTVQRLEKDGAASFETLMAIAQAFDIDVKQLSPSTRAQKTSAPKTEVYLLPRLLSGKDLADIVGGAELFQVEHDAHDDERAVNAMMSILKEVKNDILRWHDAYPAEKLRIELTLSQEINEIGTYGFYLFGIKRNIPRIVGKRRTQTTMCTIYMSHSRSPKIIRDKHSNMVIPVVLSEVAT